MTWDQSRVVISYAQKEPQSFLRGREEPLQAKAEVIKRRVNAAVSRPDTRGYSQLAG